MEGLKMLPHYEFFFFFFSPTSTSQSLIANSVLLVLRVLLRVRMLYYLRQEVIGDQAERILEGADSRSVDFLSAIFFTLLDNIFTHYRRLICTHKSLFCVFCCSREPVLNYFGIVNSLSKVQGS